jgi:hypothetical protein
MVTAGRASLGSSEGGQSCEWGKRAGEDKEPEVRWEQGHEEGGGRGGSEWPRKWGKEGTEAGGMGDGGQGSHTEATQEQTVEEHVLAAPKSEIPSTGFTR